MSSRLISFPFFFVRSFGGYDATVVQLLMFSLLPITKKRAGEQEVDKQDRNLAGKNSHVGLPRSLENGTAGAVHRFRRIDGFDFAIW